MYTVRVKIESASPYSPSRYHETEKKAKESHDDYEKRTWREKAHYDEKGMCYIPPMSFKNALCDAAQMLSLRIPGRGTATYTKHVEAGVMIFEGLPLGLHKDKSSSVKVHCHADGKRNSGKRVMRYFPIFAKWGGELEFAIVDTTVTPEVFERHLREAGALIGVGRWRPRNRGLFGRFRVLSLRVEGEVGEAA